MDRTLFVLNVQPAFADKNGEYEKCLKFVREHGNKYARVIGTLFTNKYDAPNRMYLNNIDQKKYEKMTDKSVAYFTDIPHLVLFKTNSYIPEWLKSVFDSRAKIDIIGCDADSAVLGTCFALWGIKADFRVFADYIYSSDNSVPKEEIIKIMKKNFGKCIIEGAPEFVEETSNGK